MEKTTFKSGLERSWHEELEELKIEHTYEELTISIKMDGKLTSYTPDFVLPGQGFVIEVKGSHPWEGTSMQKTRMLANMGYRVLKCCENGKFNFIDNESGNAFILQCSSCYKHFFACSEDEPCPFCKNEIFFLIIRDGKAGIKAWKENRNIHKWLFDQEAFNHINNTLSDDTRDTHKGVYEKLCGSPQSLSYNAETIFELRKLFSKYPNMEEVKKYLFSIIDTLGVRLDDYIIFQPILLEGSPGCGKTSFSTEFAKIVAKDNFRKIELSNGMASFSITGNDRGFSTAEPGLILQSMFSDGFAPVKNPLIILDELDKCGKGTYNPENVFHTLLERTSARVYTDNFFGIPIDASKINYIGLCNDSSEITYSILDRFKHFTIRDYYPCELRDIVIPAIYTDWIEQENIDPSRVPQKLSLEIRSLILKEIDAKPRKIIPMLTQFLTLYLYTDPKTNTVISLFTPKERKKWKELCGERKKEVEIEEKVGFFDFSES